MPSSSIRAALPGTSMSFTACRAASGLDIDVPHPNGQSVALAEGRGGSIFRSEGPVDP